MPNKPYRIAEQKIKAFKEINAKIRIHKMKSALIVLLAAALIIAAACGIYLWYQSITYTDYQVLERTDREDSPGTTFTEFHGNILKYNNDGAFYMDTSNRLIWNQTYEMQEPAVDVCETYAVIYDKGGKQIYIMDTKGAAGQVTANMAIQQVHVANQGTIVILMENQGTGYIQLYDKKGEFLAEGELHTKNSGYPLDLSLSNDGRKMAVSMLDVNEGTVKTTITFYNFGAAGQNQIDNIVGSFFYSGTIIPKIVYLNNTTLAAFGDRELLLFDEKRIPSVKKEIPLTGEVQSIFYNAGYVGAVTKNEQSEEADAPIPPYGMTVYDLGGGKVCHVDFAMEYTDVAFLQNNEICLRNDLECTIYTLRGKERFHYNFETGLSQVMSDGLGRRYLFLLDKVTEKVRLK